MHLEAKRHLWVLAPLVTALPVWMLAVAANWRGDLPTWALPAIGAVLLAVPIAAYRRFTRRIDADDPLVAWREFWLVRALTIDASTPSDVELTVVLAQSAEPDAPTIHLRFRKVQWLRFGQFGRHAPTLRLAAIDLGTARKDGMRFRIRDAWNEAVRFDCRDFEQLDPSPATP